MPNQTADRELRARLQRAIEHFEHVLPGQAAIRDFVHHNTLHGFEQLDFPEALDAAYKVTGAYGYLADEEFRELYKQGRIELTDLQEVIRDNSELKAEETIFKYAERTVRQEDIYLATLLHAFKPVTGYQLSWQVGELGAFRTIQSDVNPESRERLLTAAGEDGRQDEADAVEDLWKSCLHVLGLDHFILHPEDLLDLTPEQAEQMLSDLVPDEDHPEGQPMMDNMILRDAGQQLNELFGKVGDELTLEGMLKVLTGQDLLEEIRPLLIRYLASFLDQGFAAWNDPDRSQGFYAVWRASAATDLAWIFEELPEWMDSLDALPEDPFDTVVIELKWLGLAEDKWEAYLQRLALELPGWSGMFLWRHQRPGYEGLDDVRVDMMDYLAVRLVLERLFAQKLCRELWQVEASLDVIGWYLRRHLPEFMVRYTFYSQRLPEYLVTLAQRQLNCSDAYHVDERQWLHLAHLIWTWKRSPASDKPEGYTVFSSAWPLFRMMQHLGLSGATVRSLNIAQVDMIFACMEAVDEQHAGYLWLQAYERHYSDQLFNAIVNNHGRGRWQTRAARADAQIVFCMDDREEGMRRHLEEHNPNIETLGAAGFFGIPINWRGIDDTRVTALCPVVVTPAHEVRETVRPGHEASKRRHDKHRSLRLKIKDLVYQGTRRNLLSSTLLMLLAAPAVFLILLAKVVAPLPLGRWTERLRMRVDGCVPTDVSVSTEHPDQVATPEHPRVGFTDSEQADRVQGFFRSIGLQKDFAPLVVMMGHGSSSQNNPHLAAYDCGACSGKHGGPNARAFAAMANRPGIRTMLRERGLDLPDDTWVLGAEHDTCNEFITWYDSAALPDNLQENFVQLKQDLAVATLGSAHERARRFVSAPANPSPRQARRHIAGRAFDFSEARPELGHATNAAAIIGRRSISQGAFLDRRVFLISYDPTQDPEGDVLETILLAVGPVGAGISLEYYFSTVNNDQYGCGSKITHNVTSLLGVMQGASSDLRTGLPKQMTEIHEAMRLQVAVEVSTEILTKIYQRQPLLQQLVGNGWILLSAIDPDSGAITLFKPEQGFVPWQGSIRTLPSVACSTDWYRGCHDPLPPALIENRADRAVSHG
ncbi:MAG: DUF2309 domain-containing protein [Gammaproteobacteria bacterium]|nr:MAG: DUF2309 domain-containing protein [Gammaproteobacteria bacterium]